MLQIEEYALQCKRDTLLRLIIISGNFISGLSKIGSPVERLQERVHIAGSTLIFNAIETGLFFRVPAEGKRGERGHCDQLISPVHISLTANSTSTTLLDKTMPQDTRLILADTEIDHELELILFNERPRQVIGCL